MHDELYLIIWNLLANAYSTEHVYYNNVLFRFPKIKSKNVLVFKCTFFGEQILEPDYLEPWQNKNPECLLGCNAFESLFFRLFLSAACCKKKDSKTVSFLFWHTLVFWWRKSKLPYFSSLKVSKFQKQIVLLSFEPKTERNISALRIDP